MNEALHPHHFAHQPLPNPTHLFNSPHAPPTLVSQHELDPLDFNPFDSQLDSHHDLNNPFDTPSQYDSRNQPRFHEIRSTGSINGFSSPHGHANQFAVLPRASARQQHDSGGSRGQFGILTPHPQLASQPQSNNSGLGSLRNDIDTRSKAITDGGTTEGHFSNMKLIESPPNLEEWKKKLFDVDDTITLTEDEYV